MLMTGAVGSAYAQSTDGTWAGPGAEWTTGGNWSSSPTVPNGTATFTNNGAPTAVTISNSASIDTLSFTAAAPAYSFTIGNAATFDITGSTVNAGTVNPAFTIGAGATLALGNGVFAEIGSLSGAGTVTLGSDGSSLMAITGNSNATFSGLLSGAGSLEFNVSGITTLTGASNGGKIGRIGGDLTLCDCSVGGGLTIDGGSLKVDGAGQGITVLGGTLSVINGGTLRTDQELLVASNMLISGAGSTVRVDGYTGVGVFDPGPSLLTIAAGGVLNSRGGAEIDGYFGGPGAGTPEVIVTGAGSTWNVGGLGLSVGEGSTGGPGKLTISNGGTVNATTGMGVGDSTLGTSLVTVTGAGSTLNVDLGLFIGAGCGCGPQGTMTIADGGTVNSTGFTAIGSNSTLNLGTGGLAGSIVTPTLTNDGQIVANFTDTLTLAANIDGAGSIRKLGTGKLTLTGNNTYTGGTTIGAGTIAASSDANLGDTSSVLTLGLNLLGNPGGTLETTASFASPRAITLNSGGGTINTNSGVTTTLNGVIDGAGPLTKAGIGTLVLTGTNTYTGGTRINGGTLAISADANLGGAAGTLSFNGGTLQTTASFASARSTTLNAGGGTFNTDGGVTTTLSGAIDGTGALFKTGLGTLTLDGAKTHTGGTVVNAGTLRLGAGGALASTGALVVNGGTFDLNGNNQTVALLAGGGGTVALGSGTLTVNQSATTAYAGALTGAGGLVKSGGGTLILSGINTYTGGTTLNAGGLVVNGSLASVVTVNGGILSGSGTTNGLILNAGMIAPGNSIGTLTINGTFTQGAGTIYQVEVNAAGQGDRINVVGAPGTAIINGGTVQVLAAQGSYGRTTTYTILNATGGVTGTYANVTSNFAFLTPSLAYDSNNVFLTLFLSSTAFASGAQTANQFAVGTALDRGYSAATGDFANVLGVLTGLSTAQGPAALDALSGQAYSGFGTANVQGGLLFMNVVGQQMSLARGGSGGGSRVALAQACEVACDADAASPFSVWGSALGGTGSVAGNGNSSTLTYNLGGFAAGVDYRADPRILVGLGLGYASGNQWLGGFNGRGTSDSYNAALYASFTPGAFYIDALAGYGFNDNQMTRMIAIPGLASRTAIGRTGANQFTGQAEAGYRFDVYAPAAASVTPFARFQTMSVGQNAFTETGANSLNLSVARQTTTSIRTVLGAELQGALDMGLRDKIALQLRLGWSYEYADVSRPVSASFAGAPGSGYTVYGATPQRSGAVLGLAANTAIAQNTSIYMRYDGEFGTGTDNHVLSAGLRMSW